MPVKKVLLIEPYYGGSHKRFIDGLRCSINADFLLLSLPPRKWKMRMQLSAPWFIEQIKQLEIQKRFFDIVLFSSFIDVAVFKALVQSIHGWNNGCKHFTYFHENQFSYPGVQDKQTNHQFTAINFTTALVSDSIAFNSQFNKDSFLAQCRKYLDKAADMNFRYAMRDLSRKSLILYPGLDFSIIDTGEIKEISKPPVIIWNHRWEHDKNPEEFFQVLFELDEDSVEFRLCVLGQSFRSKPAIFSEAANRLNHKILHMGYCQDQYDYYRFLLGGDIVVSTALHEFFGMSVIEAVRAGCVPVLPKRLSYLELFDDSFLYEEGDLYNCLRNVLSKKTKLSAEQAKQMTESYSWQSLADEYHQWLN